MTVHLVLMLDAVSQRRHTSLHPCALTAAQAAVHELVNGGFRQPPATQVVISQVLTEHLDDPVTLQNQLTAVADQTQITIWFDEIALPESLQYELL